MCFEFEEVATAKTTSGLPLRRERHKGRAPHAASIEPAGRKRAAHHRAVGFRHKVGGASSHQAWRRFIDSWQKLVDEADGDCAWLVSQPGVVNRIYDLRRYAYLRRRWKLGEFFGTGRRRCQSWPARPAARRRRPESAQQ